jgi:hypothetical protein
VKGPASRKIVILGIMSRHPVGGVVWQTLHYLLGLRRLGFDPYYVEAGAHQPSALLVDDDDAGDPGRCVAAARFLDRTLRRVDMGDRWAFHALHTDGRCYGLSECELLRLYGSAELIINLCGATLPREEHCRTGRLVYLETDPVLIQVELHEGHRETIEYLEPHGAFFTFAENYGRDVCALPVSDRFHFIPTRQPVLMDEWDPVGVPPGDAYTTVANWKQQGRDVVFGGEVYRWSKHHEFLRFLDLPHRTGLRFQMALSPRGYGPEDDRLLKGKGWEVLDALAVSSEPDGYRDFIRSSRGEFTVSKDQNIRFRTGWFSDRSATYLAAGRPVVTQDTGFQDVLPTGEGLFTFRTIDDIAVALEEIEGNYARHSAAARELARSYFAHDVVLPRLLEDAGV